MPWSQRGAWSVQDTLYETLHTTLVHGAFQSKGIQPKVSRLNSFDRARIFPETSPFIHAPVSYCYFALNFDFHRSTYERPG